MKIVQLLKLHVLFCVATAVCADATIPLIHPQPGVVLLGHPEAHPVRLEVFIDLGCSDSMKSWATLKELAVEYGDRLEVVIQQFPLPYHTHAFVLTQGYFLILDSAPTSILNYTELVFSEIETFSNKKTMNKTTTEVIRELGDLQESVTGVGSEVFQVGIHDYRYTAAKVWKYGASKGVSGTPWFFLNGIDLNLDSEKTLHLNHWKKLIGKLIEKKIPKTQSFSLPRNVENCLNQSTVPSSAREVASYSTNYVLIVFMFVVSSLMV